MLNTCSLLEFLLWIWLRPYKWEEWRRGLLLVGHQLWRGCRTRYLPHLSWLIFLTRSVPLSSFYSRGHWNSARSATCLWSHKQEGLSPSFLPAQIPLQDTHRDLYPHTQWIQHSLSKQTVFHCFFQSWQWYHSSIKWILSTYYVLGTLVSPAAGVGSRDGDRHHMSNYKCDEYYQREKTEWFQIRKLRLS